MKTSSTFQRIAVVCGLTIPTAALGVHVAHAQCTATEFAKLLASDGARNDEFGHSVAMSGDTAVIGAHDWHGGGPGAAYVLVRDGSVWAEATKLIPPDGDTFGLFGFGVAISGDTIVVGAYRDDDCGDDAGAAYIFERDAGGDDNWGQVAKITACDCEAGDMLGRYVGISGDTVVVGAHRDDSETGSAYVFEKGDGWGDGCANQVAKLVASDREVNDYFGMSAAISGDVVVIGAYTDTNENGPGAGAAYVFQKPADGWHDMTETAKLTAGDGAEGDLFGASLAVWDGTVVVGADYDDGRTGSAYIFEKGAGWIDGGANQVARLTASDRQASDDFGYFVAISGDTAVIGAQYDDGRTGSAYVFLKPASGWEDTNESAKLIAFDGAAWDHFGAVAVDANTALVGAYHDDDNGDRSGSVYVFAGMSDCNENGTLDICEMANDTSADENGNGVLDECENQPPIVTCNDPVVLWSPNHELVDVSSAFSVADPDGDEVTLSFRVISDESETPETGDGTGRHAPDFKDEYPDGRGLLVRSERRGPEDGRYYIFVIAADDGNGGVTTEVCVAAVAPHDQNQQSLDDVIAQAEAAAVVVQDAVDSGGELPLPPPGFYEHGLADPLGPKQ